MTENNNHSDFSGDRDTLLMLSGVAFMVLAQWLVLSKSFGAQVPRSDGTRQPGAAKRAAGSGSVSSDCGQCSGEWK